MVIELGGNIELVNFDDLEPGKLVVVKKIVGSYTKKIATAAKNFKKISIELKDKKIIGKVTIGETIHSEEAEDDNLFFALDKVLNKLEKEAK